MILKTFLVSTVGWCRLIVRQCTLRLIDHCCLLLACLVELRRVNVRIKWRTVINIWMIKVARCSVENLCHRIVRIPRCRCRWRRWVCRLVRRTCRHRRRRIACRINVSHSLWRAGDMVSRRDWIRIGIARISDLMRQTSRIEYRCLNVSLINCRRRCSIGHRIIEMTVVRYRC